MLLWRKPRSQPYEAGEEEREKLAAMVNDAAKKLGEIEAHRSAAEALATTPLGEAPSDDENRQSIREIATAALEKPKAERTIDDFRALIVKSVMDKGWGCVLRRARAMEYLFDNADDKNAIFALFYRGVAHSMLEQYQAAHDAYTELDDRFGASEVPALREPIAMALVNKGVTLVQIEKPEDAIGGFDEFLRRFGESEEPALRESIAMALMFKGVALAQSKKPRDAILTLEKLTEDFGDSSAAWWAKMAGDAYFNLACAYGLDGKVKDAIASLKNWADSLGTFDCKKVAEDADFDKIRTRTMFKKFLKEQGC